MTTQEFSEIRRRVEAVREKIERATTRAGRRADEVRLVAVTKTHPVECALAALEAGVTELGENRVQEAVQKYSVLLTFPIAQRLQPRFHLIGHLQTNKAKWAVQWFHLIHSLDSAKLADELQKHTAREGRSCEVLIQVNVSGEATKFGVKPAAAPDLIEHILATCPDLTIRGFMTMAPFEMDPEATRPHFRQLRELRDAMASRFANEARFTPTELSMGMTNDFEVAIEEGATIVRIGSAIFGTRSP